jgi:hypothetical protein
MENKQIKCYCGHTIYCDCSPLEEPKQELELKDFDNGDILDVLNMGNVEYLGNGDIIYNPNLFFVKRGDKWFIKTEKPKQETLEEAAENMWLDPMKNLTSKMSFIAGAKWQQERMYSEADKIMKFLDTEVELKLSDIKTIERIKWYFQTYFEQFKKK